MDVNIIIASVIMVCIYIIGVYLHVKVIKISRKDKEMTWKFDLINSCLMIVHHGHCVIMEIITNIIEDLHLYTGEWLCYASKVLTYCGIYYTTELSMTISLLKYVIIVQWKKSRNVGQEKVKRIFFWIYLLYPFIMILIHLIIKPNFFWVHDGYARIDRCLGDPKNNWGPDSNRTQIKVHTICQTLVVPSQEYYFAYSVYILKRSICWGQVIVSYGVTWNIWEVIIYCRIFGFMRR